jgi:hypothetical protein
MKESIVKDYVSPSVILVEVISESVLASSIEDLENEDWE